MQHAVVGRARARYALILWGAMVYAFLYLPILALVAHSFNRATTTAVWGGATLAWYRRLWQSPDMLRAFENSLLIATATTLCAVTFGTMAAFAMHKYAFRGKRFWQGLIYVNLIVPELVLALALFAWLTLFEVRLGFVTVIIGHVVFGMALVIIIVRARLHGFDALLEEVSADLGATPWQTFRYVTLPLIMPGIVSAALLCFSLSLDDFILTFFLQGPGLSTLPVYIYTKIRRSLSPEINALATIFLCVGVFIMLLFNRFAKRENA